MKISRIYRLVYNVLFDMKYGRFLGGVKKSPYVIKGANDTANSDYKAMAIIFKDKIKFDDVLVDVGCGKGRVINYWMSNFGNNQIVGIELDPVIASATSRRLAKYKNVTIFSGSALELFPNNATIFYLFNPFNCHIMDKFKKALIDRFFLKDKGWIHSFSIIYYNPTCANVFHDDDKFCCSEIEMPDGFHKGLLINQFTS
jgi:hypothetical protein